MCALGDSTLKGLFNKCYNKIQKSCWIHRGWGGGGGAIAPYAPYAPPPLDPPVAWYCHLGWL